MSDKHAVIIDDNSKNVSILARMLASEGVSNTQVMDPREVETVLESIEAADVIFLDLEMPNLNGFEVLEQIKDNPKYQTVPVVAYTVHVSEISVAHQQGFDGFIGKPLDSEKFPDQLSRIFSGEGVWETF